MESIPECAKAKIMHMTYLFIVLSLSLISSQCLSTEIFKTSICLVNRSASSLCLSASKRHSDSHLNLFSRKQEYWEQPTQETDKKYSLCGTLTWSLMGRILVHFLWDFLFATSWASDFLFSVPIFPGSGQLQAMEWEFWVPLRLCLSLSMAKTELSQGSEQLCVATGHWIQNAMEAPSLSGYSLNDTIRHVSALFNPPWHPLVT